MQQIQDRRIRRFGAAIGHVSKFYKRLLYILGRKSIVNFYCIILNLFILRIVRLNPPQVFYHENVGFFGFFGSLYYLPSLLFHTK